MTCNNPEAYVYVITDNEHYKIGKAANVKTRLKQLQTGSPKPLAVVGVLPCPTDSYAYIVESILHETYSDKKVINEWFALTDEDVQSLQLTQLDSNDKSSCGNYAIVSSSSTEYTAVLDEQRSITKACNGNVLPAYLYNYYVSICQIPSWDLTNDSMVAKQLGIVERKVADTRRLLTKLGWIRFDTHTHKGVRYGIWYIGKEVVAAKFGTDTTIDEYISLGIVTNEEEQLLKQAKEISLQKECTDE